uniref:Uncharacterized protein n=1 Tax=Solanum lycopersicum TaxID=4081 RepID=A0A3Q7F877_SOLLC
MEEKKKKAKICSMFLFSSKIALSVLECTQASASSGRLHLVFDYFGTPLHFGIVLRTVDGNIVFEGGQGKSLRSRGSSSHEVAGAIKYLVDHKQNVI